jgi:hypothetical protein
LQGFEDVPGWNGCFDQPDVVMHKLGNLVLLNGVDNSRIRNLPFPDKMRALFSEDAATHVTELDALRSMADRNEPWDTTAFLKRHDRLMRRLAKR